MAEILHFTTHSDAKADTIPLVLLHGWGLNSAIWQPLIERLPANFLANFQVITIDLPGFGVNYANTIQPYTLANIVDKINALIDQPAVYLGWSLGGLVATEMALTYPDKVRALVTVASSPCFVETDSTSAQKSSATTQEDFWPGIKTPVLKAFHQQLKVDAEKTIAGFLKIQAMGSPHIRQDIKQIKQLIMQYPTPTEAILDQSLSLLESSDHRAALATIKPPFLRLYGSADSLVPKKVIELIDKLAITSESHIFLQASHAPFISHPEEFVELLTAWLMKAFSR